MVKITIDGIQIEATESMTILNAAKQAGITIPTLCYLEGVNDIGACRICLVEAEGYDQLLASCNTLVEEGMVIRTNSPKVRAARRINLELILSQHDVNCTSCVRSGNCTLQTLAKDLNVGELPFDTVLTNDEWPQDFPLIRDANKCIKCMRCIQICDNVQASHVWTVRDRSTRTNVGVAGDVPIYESDCALCGQCITHCPTGALHARDDTVKVYDALGDPDKIVVLQIAPAVRTAWGESFGIPREKATPELMVAALRPLGFDYIFDTTWSADLTIMEEGTELVDRLQNGGTFPMFTSCCPGWIRFAKAHYPEFLDNLSTAKSPQQMFGAATKNYFAQVLGVDPSKIFCVSVMPCVAKKHECALETMDTTGTGPDVDVVLTTREIVRMIAADHIDVANLAEDSFDDPLGVSTGAGVIFGATGGVMEAALRSGYYLVTGENPDADAFKGVRGLDGWKEAEFQLPGKTLRVAVASGLGNAERLLDAIKAGQVDYDFVEIMACPGGCAGGGGQPIHDGQELAGVRGENLYGLDAIANLRFSHENPTVLKCYEDYYGAPNSEKAHHELHSNHHDWSMPHK